MQSSSDFLSSDKPEKLSTESSVYSNSGLSFVEAWYHISSAFQGMLESQTKTTTGFSFVSWSLFV